MTKGRYIVLVVASLLAIVAIVFINNSQPAANQASPMGVGTPDNPNARIEWETKRKVNPATGSIPQNIREKELAFAENLPKAYSRSNTVWNHRGPFNVGGRTRAFAFDVADANTFIAGGVTGGIWRTTDLGESYTNTLGSEQLHSVTSIAQDTRTGKTNTWYCGTGEYYGVVSSASFSNQQSGNGIYKSIDNGQSWDLLPATVSNTPTTLYTNGDFDFVWRLVTDPTSGTDDVYAAVINGVFKSTDGGTSWNATLGLDTADASLSHYTELVVSSTGVFYACVSTSGSAEGIWRSTDGDNWINISPGGLAANVRRMAAAITPSNENVVYFIAHTPNNGQNDHQLWKYTYFSGAGTGAGGQWENLSTNLPVFPCEVFYTFEFGNYKSQSGYDMAIAVKPDDANTVFLGGTNVYRSTDGFSTSDNIEWIAGYQCDSVTPSNYVWPNQHPDQHYFSFHPNNPNKLITANDGGLYVTDNCMADSLSIEWQSLNNGYMNSQFYTLAVEPGETYSRIMVGGMQDNGTFFATNGSPTDDWKGVFYGDGSFCAISPNRENYYLSWQTGKTFKFDISDDGTTQGLTRIDPTGGSGYQFINAFILNPLSADIMYLAAGRYLWRNDSLRAIPLIGDEYNTISQGWTRITQSNIGFGGIGGNSISCLVMSSADTGRIYYGTETGTLFRLDNANGDTPIKTQLDDPGFPANAYVSSVTVNPNNADEVMITFSNYEVPSLWHSTDAGATWANVSGNLEENPDGTGNGPSVIWAEIFRLGDDTIVYLAGTSVGLYSTIVLDSLNTTWTQEGPSSIGNVVINQITSRPFDGLVAVATHGAGVYTARYKPDLSGVEEVAETDKLLEQNAPNPFKNETSIKFFVPKTGKVQLQIFDLNGKLVKQLLNETLPTGYHKIKWNGSHQNGHAMPAGTYIYELLLNNQKQSNKLVLVR